MQVERTSATELTITGNIKTTADYLEIRRLVSAQVAEGARGVRHVKARGPQAIQRGDRVGREHGGAAAAEGARRLGVRPDESHPAQR